MTKLMRKYQKWLMVGFGILLMLTFLGGPAITEIQRRKINRVVGRLDGEPVRFGEHFAAGREVTAFAELASNFPVFYVGIDDRDSTHWLLLTREAKAAGLVGEPENGAEFLEALAPIVAAQVLNQDISYLIEQDQNKKRAMEQQMAETVKVMVMRTLGNAGLNSQEAEMALAKFFAVKQLQNTYFAAPRLSVRAAAAQAKRLADAVVGDLLVVPASKLAEQMPEPPEETLRAHFEQYKGTRPGEGEYGVGYLLPARAKLSYMKLDRKAIEDAITLDPVNVRKVWSTTRAKYPGEFEAERARVESDLKRGRVDEVLGEAHSAVQREVQKVTRRLANSGRFKVLPPDWEQARPRWETIAPAVAEHIATSPVRVSIPVPATATIDTWQTRDDLQALPEIGRAAMRQGGIMAELRDVVFWARELDGNGPFAVQAGIPIIENFLEDAAGNRYYLTVEATRPESAPDDMAEIRQRVSDDYRRIQAFEQLRSQLPDLQGSAAVEGLQKVVQTFGLQPPPPPPPAEGAPTPPPPEEPVKTGVRVARAGTDSAEPALQEQAVRDQIVDQAYRIDPLTPPEQYPPDLASIAVAAPKHLSIVFFKVTRLEPVTRERLQSEVMDQQLAQRVREEELRDKAAEAFSLEALLKRHVYFSGDRRITSPDELRGETEG